MTLNTIKCLLIRWENNDNIEKIESLPNFRFDTDEKPAAKYSLQVVIEGVHTRHDEYSRVGARPGLGWRALSDAPPVAREHEAHAKSFQKEGTRTRVYDSSTSPRFTTQPLPFGQNNEKLK